MAEIIKPIQQVIQKVVSWFIDIPEIPDTPDVEEIRGTLINKSSNNAQIPVVYGERLLGGTRVFLQTSGTDNTYLYGALVLCEGEINAITEIQINDSAVTFSGSFVHGTEITSNDSKYGTTIKIQPFLGKDDQPASSTLSTLSNWGSNHKLSGICYVAFRIEWDADKYTGIPNIKVKVQGKKISTFDNSGNETTGQYSTNPAFILLDFLRNERYGKGIALTELDVPSFFTASTIADTTVTYFTGTTGKLFECHAVLNTNKKIIDNIKTLLRGMRGLLPYVQGQFKLIIETSGSAVISLNEDNIIGGINLESERKDQKFNRVLVNFVNPEKNYQADTIVYDTGHSTFKTEDGGFLQEGNITLDTIISPYQAHEFGKIILERSRNNLKLGLTTNYETLDLAIGDIVNVSSTILGITNKKFRVGGMTLNANFTASLSLQEHQESWYAFSTIDEVATISDTNFPDPFTVQPAASLTLSDDLVEYNDGTVITRLKVTIGASTDQFVENYEVQSKQTLDKDGNAVSDDFRLIGEGKALEYQLLNAIDGATYEVRTRAINSLGVKSSFITATHKVIGATEAPGNVTDFSISLIGSDQMQLSWIPVTDLDVESYEIRYQKVSDNAQWFNSTDLVRVPRRSANTVIVNRIDPPFALAIKAIDKLGNESLEPALIYSSNVSAQGYQNISNIAEHPNFTGTFNNTFRRTETGLAGSDNVITLDTITNFEDKTGLFDAVDSDFVFETGGINKNISSSGTYDFNGTITLPFIFDATFKIQLDMVSDDPYDLFDFGRGENLFENAKAPFDGNLPTNAGTNIQVGASETSLDAISTFTGIAQQGTFKGKFFKFKAKLLSLNNQARALVKGLSISLNLERRSEFDEDVASTTSTKTITFTNGFFQTPNITITGQDMSSGDYFVVNNKSATSFDITFFNSSDSIINKTFDYQAQGIGLKS
tara:strand:+ start:2224 stop:5052 length:2829 start_codon:yes stop_codon:yes gene_type:complete